MNQTEIRRIFFFLACIGLATGYLVLALNMPITVSIRSPHDDAWFVRAAERMTSGQWMGSFNQMTLIKGLGFVYFLSLSHFIGLPLTISQAVLYLLACGMLLYVLGKSGLPRWASILLLAFLLFQPALFPIRVIRDYVYASFAMIALSGIIGLAVSARIKLRHLFFLVAGLGGGFFWITREEGVWLLPSMAIGLVYGGWIAWCNGRSRHYLLQLLLFGSAWAVPVVATALANGWKYGVYSTVDFKNPQFKRALDTLNRVSTGDDVRFVPVPAHRRYAIYEISPAFSELKSYLEGVGKVWTKYGCQPYPHTCGDYAGGWFMWALRDGVSRQDHYRNAVQAEAYFQKLANEIEMACDDGRLQCKSKSLIPFMPQLSNEALREIPERLVQAIKVTLYAMRNRLHNGSSDLPINRLNAVMEFLGDPKIMPPKPAVGTGKAILSGWYYGPSRGWFEMRCGRGADMQVIRVDRLASPEIARYFHDPEAGFQRYELDVDGSSDCAIFDQTTDILIADVKNIDAHYRYKIKSGKIIFYIENITPLTAFEPLRSDVIERSFSDVPLLQWDGLHLKRQIFLLYSMISPYLLALGALAFLGAFLIRIFHWSLNASLLVAVTCLWVAYFTRIFIVVLVDVTSFPAVVQLYLLSAFPLVGAAAFVSVVIFLQAIFSKFRLMGIFSSIKP